MAAAAALLVVLGVAGYFVAWAVIRVTTEQGEFTIETDDPQVAVQLNKLGGITLKDQKTARQYVVQIGQHRLPDGEYGLAVSDPDAGLEFSTRKLTIKRGTRPAVRVWATKKDAKAPAPKAVQDSATDGHWSVLVGAEEGRFREWEAAIRNGGYHPVSLDLHTLRGKPRYNAVAVKDGKDVPWVVSRIPDGDPDDFKKWSEEGYRPLSQNGYRDGKTFYKVRLWVKDGGAPDGWAEWWSPNSAACGARVEEYRAEGYRPSRLKNYPAGDGWGFNMFLERDDGTPWVVRRGASAAHYKAVLEAAGPLGFRPLSVCAYQEGDRLLFDFVLLRGSSPLEWVARHGLSAADYLKEHARCRARGMWPQVLTGYRLNGETRYLAVWLKALSPPPGPPRAAPKVTPPEVTVLSPGAGREALVAWLERLPRTGYRPVFVNGHDLNGEARFAAIAVKDGREVVWSAFVDRADDFQKRFDEMGEKGYWPVCLAGFADRTGLGIVSVWTLHRTFEGVHRCFHRLVPGDYSRELKKDEGYPCNVSAYPVGDSYNLTALFGPGGSWRFLYGATAERYGQFLAEWGPKGYRPVTAFVGRQDGKPRFGVVMVRDPGTGWVNRRGLSAADFEKEQRRFRDQGYRPVLIVGYPENGESRYLAVWVRPAKSSTRARTGREVPELAAFDEAMEQFMAERNIPAGALAVMMDGKLVLSRGYGFADPQRKRPVAPDAPFRLASLTKPITAAAVHKLIGEGKLKPDTRVAALLDLAPPPGQKMDPRWRDVTVAHLLDHRGGWDSGKSFDPMFRPLEIAAALGKRGPATARDVVRYMAGQPLQFDPGSKSVYSNFGYCLLGRVIEKVTGRTYVDYVRTALLAPLGVTTVALGRSLPRDRAPGEPWYCDPGKGRNVFRTDDNERVPAPDGAFCLEAMDSHGGLIASAPDVARFLHAYSLDGRPRSKTSGAGCAFGSLPGTFTVALYRADGVEIVALFDQRRDPSGLPYERIREALEKAADGVRHWPAK